MLFVLSTGRCGSTSIASLLNQFPGISCVHEPEPPLVYEVDAYLKGKLSRDNLISLLHESRRPPEPGIIYGESNQKLAYIVDVIQEAFPDAAFLWLVRNGIDVVASYYSRGTYREDEIDLFPNPSRWVKHRVCAHEVSEMPENDWRLLDSFARNCWFWAWTNEKVRNDLLKAKAKWLLVRLEDLNIMIEKIAEFIGVSQVPAARIPKLNTTPTGKVIKAQLWDRSQRNSFVRFCGPLMDELYPGWFNDLKLNCWQIFRNDLISFFSARHAFGRFTQKTLKNLPQTLRDCITKLSDGRRN